MLEISKSGDTVYDDTLSLKKLLSELMINLHCAFIDV